MAGKTIATLQAGRALAALAVVLVHAAAFADAATDGMPAWLRSISSHGWLGVDFFFVLSGFIMMHLHQDASRFDLGLYMRKRLTRVFVPYFPVGLAVAAVYALWPESADSSSWGWIGSATLIPGTGQPALAVAWTLQFELAFYAIFGLALAAGRPFAGVAAWVVAAVAYNLVIGAPPARLNPLLNPIVAEFLFGMAAARLVDNPRLRYPFLAAAGSFLLYVGAGAGTEARAIFALSMALLVVSLVRAEQRGALNVSAPVIFLGAASYSIYLIHYPVAAIGSRLFDTWWLSLAAGIALSVICGVAYHLGWEAPGLRMVGRRGWATWPARPRQAPANTAVAGCGVSVET